MTYEKNLEGLSQNYPMRCLGNNRVQISEFTYGVPEIKTWAENSKLKIGKFCCIADKVTIFLGGEHRSDWVSTYPFNVFLEKYSFIKGHPKTKGDVIIGNDVWIASGATILSGVTIGDGAILGCNSVISKDVPPYAIVAGNPGKIIRYRFKKSIINELLQIKWWDWPLKEIEKAIPLLLNDDIENFINYVHANKFLTTINKLDKNSSLDLCLKNIILDIDKEKTAEILKHYSSNEILYYIKNKMSNKVEALNAIAVYNYNHGKFDEVIPFLSEAFSIDNKHKDTLFNLGVVLYSAGEYIMARNYFEKIENKDLLTNEYIDTINSKMQ